MGKHKTITAGMFPVGQLFRHKYKGAWEYGRFADPSGEWTCYGEEPPVMAGCCWEGHWKGETFILRREARLNG